MARSDFDHFALAGASASQSIRDMVGPSIRDMASMSSMVDAARRQADEQLARMRPSISQAFERAGRALDDARVDFSRSGVDLARMVASTGSEMLLQQAKLASEAVLQQFRASGFHDDTIRHAAQVLENRSELDFSINRMLQEALSSTDHVSLSLTDYAFQTTQQALEAAAIPLSTMRNRFAAIESVLSGIGPDSNFERLARQISGLDLTEVSSWSAASTMLGRASWEELSGLASELTRVDTRSPKRRKGKAPGRSKNVATTLEAPPVAAPVSQRDRIILIITIMVALFGDGIVWRLRDMLFTDPPKQELLRESIDLAIAPSAIPLRAAPDADAEILAEAQAGAFIGILEIKADWALAEIAVGPESKIRGWIKGGSYLLGHEALPDKSPTLESPAPAFPLPLPILIERAGSNARARFVEFFTGTLRVPNTRMAYWHACAAFFEHCAAIGLTLEVITSEHVSNYVGQLSQARAAQTVKQHVAAIRRMFEHLVTGQILSSNPAALVRSPKKASDQSATASLDDDQVRLLFSQFDPTLLPDLRDRAILATMLYGFVRASVVIKMRVRDFEHDSETAWFIVEGKDGLPRRMRAHPTAMSFIDAYLTAVDIKAQPDSLLFRSLGRGRKGLITTRGLRREDVYAMVRRRAAAVGLPVNIGCQSLRRAGIVNYLKNGGAIESAAHLAGHTHLSTTQLYDPQGKTTDGADIKRMRF